MQNCKIGFGCIFGDTDGLESPNVDIEATGTISTGARLGSLKGDINHFGNADIKVNGSMHSFYAEYGTAVGRYFYNFSDIVGPAGEDARIRGTTVTGVTTLDTQQNAAVPPKGLSFSIPAHKLAFDGNARASFSAQQDIDTVKLNWTQPTAPAIIGGNILPVQIGLQVNMGIKVIPFFQQTDGTDTDWFIITTEDGPKSLLMEPPQEEISQMLFGEDSFSNKTYQKDQHKTSLSNSSMQRRSPSPSRESDTSSATQELILPYQDEERERGTYWAMTTWEKETSLASVLTILKNIEHKIHGYLGSDLHSDHRHWLIRFKKQERENLFPKRLRS